MKTKPLYLTVAATFVVATALGACNRQQSDEAKTEYSEMQNTASEKYDQAKADVREGYNDASATMDDASITAKVKTSIIAEPDIKAMDINVDTADGVVTLSGTVTSPEQRTRVEEIARNTGGVKSVQNRLDIQA